VAWTADPRESPNSDRRAHTIALIRARFPAAAVDFTATVDGSGYVTEFQATFAGVDDGEGATYVLKLADFGQAPAAEVPSGPDVVTAPESAYQTM
jgi:hypothetical protein